MPETTVSVPESFLAEVAAVRAELDDVVAPMLLAFAARYRQLHDHFEPIRREANEQAFNGYVVPWVESGAEEVWDRFYALLDRVRGAFEDRVWTS